MSEEHHDSMVLGGPVMEYENQKVPQNLNELSKVTC